MKKIIPLLFLLFSCGSSPGQVEELSHCDQTKYYLLWHLDVWNPQWKMQYFDYIVNCERDTTLLKKLAWLDADNGNYTFIIYGLIGDMQPFENIYKKYPIGFHTAGCDPPEMGEFYNNEVKKLLKLNEGLDYDSIIKAEFESEDSVVYPEIGTASCE